MSKRYLGINGLGRIGKLVLWNQFIERHFDGYIISLGRTAGKSLHDLIDFILTDSTYGSLDRFLYGYSKSDISIEIINEENYEILIDGNYIKFLTSDRNPKDIKWADNHVDVVVDCTGVFLDPTAPSDAPRGSVRGHIDGGAKKVVVSAPFKIKGKELKLPEDTTMLVYGINHETFETQKHDIISAASCRITALSHDEAIIGQYRDFKNSYSFNVNNPCSYKQSKLIRCVTFSRCR